MASASLLLLLLPLLLLLLVSFSASDDADVMTKLAASIKPAPASWTTGTAFCSWPNVTCNNNGEVTAINLFSQSLTGTLPSNLNSLSQLTTLSLQGNLFSGELPSLANLSNLQTVFLDNNSFTSIAAGAFSGLTSLQFLSLSFNVKLSPWSFPSELTQSTGLVKLYAGSCNITGSIPDIFGSFPSLTDLRLSFNPLTGSLPNSFAGSGIQNIWLNGNKLAGSIGVIGSMNQLSQVWLHGNTFTGSIPDLSNCTNIFDLQLRDNQLTGVVPPSVTALPNLLNVSLQNNKLQGPYPAFKSEVNALIGTTNSFCLGMDKAGVACDAQVTALIAVAGAFGYPMTLAGPWKGNNACNQWSFVSCDSSGNVTSVNLGNKQLNGSISPAFGDLKHLQRLYLSDNNLTGTIPESLTTLANLQTLDVSNNNISGQVPKFGAGVTVNYKGNSFIGIDIDTGGGGGGSKTNSTGSGGASRKSSTSVGLVVGVVIGVVVLVGVVLFVMYKCYIRRRDGKFGKVHNPELGAQMVKSNNCMGGANGYAGLSSDLQSQTSGDHNEMPVFEGGNVVISLQVLRQVTNNFSEENILGRGGFGVVYGGELHDGTKIAVKRMESNAMGTKGMNEFQAEIAVLTKVRHRHLVALLGYCINDNERLLVYEHMPQGTLGQHLFEWRELGYPPLTWKQRVTIALDVGRGVEYLHSLAQSSFIHRDLKPSNILLGDDMRAKVADFGLVKNAPDGNYSMVTRLAGTFGYLAPEYAATGRVTTKVDVYAFGVILMEVVTGRKVLDETMPEERCHLVTWFRRILINKESIRKAIDETLDPDDETYESILRVAELAGHCTAREPYQRPDMGHAVNVLGPLVEQWRPTCQEDEEGSGVDLHMSLPQALRRWQADEGTSTMFSDVSLSDTQSSIPAKPSGFPDSFNSTDCR